MFPPSRLVSSRTLGPLHVAPSSQVHWDLIQTTTTTTTTTATKKEPILLSPNNAETILPTTILDVTIGRSPYDANGSPPPPPPPPFPIALRTPRSNQPNDPNKQNEQACKVNNEMNLHLPDPPLTFSHARNLSRARIVPPPPPPPRLAPAPPPVLSPQRGRKLSGPNSPHNGTMMPLRQPHIRVPSNSIQQQQPQPQPSPTQRNQFQPGRSQPPTTSIAVPTTPKHNNTRPVNLNIQLEHARTPSQATIKILPPPLPVALSANTFEPPPPTPRKLPPPLPRAVNGSDASPPPPLPPTPAPSANSVSDAKANSATRAKIEGEILSTEATYLSNLQHFVSEFIVPLRIRLRSTKKEDSVGRMDEDALNRIAGNLETLTQFHATFYADLSNEYGSSNHTPHHGHGVHSGSQGGVHGMMAVPPTQPNLAKVFLKYMSFFKLYTAYLNSYESCVLTMEEQRENSKFEKFIQEFRMKTVKRTTTSSSTSSSTTSQVTPSQAHVANTPSSNLQTPMNQSNQQPGGGGGGGGGLAPMDYIIQPVQRLPRYVLLLQQLLKFSQPNSESSSQIQQALTAMESIASFVNDRKRSVENMNKLLDISLHLSGEVPSEVRTLIEPHRKLLREGPLQIVSTRSILGMGLGTTKETNCIVRLFNDMILWTTGTNKFKGYLDLNTTTLHEMTSTDGGGTGGGTGGAGSVDNLSWQLFDSKTTIMCRATTFEDSQSWIEQITNTITQLQQEKDATRRRQRVAKARSTGHTHRSQLRTLIKENLFQLSSTASSTLGADSYELDDEHETHLVHSDPQLQNEWLDKEARAKRVREGAGVGGGGGETGEAHSTGTVGAGPMATSTGLQPQFMMPKEIINQLKLQQAGGSASTCTTTPNSVSSSRDSSLSRRPSSNSTTSSNGGGGSSTTPQHRHLYSHSHTRSNGIMHQHTPSMREEELHTQAV